MDKFLYLFVIVFSVTCTKSLYADGPNRILNGSPANENQFPYMISLQRLIKVHSDTRGHRCGGALVTLQHAVTAASCTFEFVSPETNDVEWTLSPINPAEYRVFAGSVLLTNDTSADRIRRIANITIHPKYNTSYPYGYGGNRFSNDIAVIILGTPFSSNTVARVLVTDLSTYTEPVSCNLSGWGEQGSSPTTSTQLMYSQMLTMYQTVCTLMVGSPLLPTMLCAWAPGAGIIEGAAGCAGDEGSPLVCHGSLAGLLIQSSNCSEVPTRPQLFTRVSSYTTWIDDVVAQPIPELGPEPSTEAPPMTSPVTSPTTPTPAPDGASTFQPGMAVLAVIAIAQIITAKFLN